MYRAVFVIVTAAVTARAAVSIAVAEPTANPEIKATAMCQHRGYVDLFPQDGVGTAANPSTTFETQAACMRWVRTGGAVGQLRPELIPGSGTTMHFWLTISGAAPVGTTAVCGDLPLLVNYTLSGAGMSSTGCLDPPVYDQPFQVLYGPCASGQAVETTVVIATASGGVVGRTVSGVCA
jgi:hypothetical protein